MVWSKAYGSTACLCFVCRDSLHFTTLLACQFFFSRTFHSFLSLTFFYFSSYLPLNSSILFCFFSDENIFVEAPIFTSVRGFIFSSTLFCFLLLFWFVRQDRFSTFAQVFFSSETVLCSLLSLFGTMDNFTSLFISSVLCLLLIPNVSAYFLVIDAHAEDCFFDRVSSGTKLGLTFEVVDGGFLDIDVMIKGLFFLGFVSILKVSVSDLVPFLLSRPRR